MHTAHKWIHRITLAALAFMVCLGAIIVFAGIKPFWVDEWFIILSLKTRSVSGLFDKLEFMQQFPRVYLALIKVFAAQCNYSYLSLKMPAYLISLCSMALAYNLMKRLFSEQVFARYLFVLIILSSNTFTEYFVDTKQYAMDIFLCLVALWQLLTLLQVKPGVPLAMDKYLLLCASFVAVPFFSYTYPIAVMPVYAVVLLQSIMIIKGAGNAAAKRRTILLQWLPLMLGMASIAAFYIIDVKQLATDKIMYDRWDFMMMKDGNKFVSFLFHAYRLFAQLGSGDLFENVFGVLGVLSFIYGVIITIKTLLKKNMQLTLETQVRLYSCLLILLSLLLFLLKKLPLGTGRLNAFAMPATALLIIWFMVGVGARFPKVQKVLPLLLYAGVVGNICTTYINLFTGDEYKKMSAIYKGTQRAIQQAQATHIPILVTPNITYPYQQAVIDAGKPNPAVWVLQTFPAYNMQQHLPVYAINDTNNTKATLQQLGLDSAMVGDGVEWRVVRRP